MNNDPASLQNLHDIIMPSPVPLWPPAPGWYVVFALVFAIAFFFVFRSVLRYHRNAYRRAALQELMEVTTIAQIAALLKRVALVVYPRTQVAGLTCEPWLQWLSHTSGLAIPEPVAAALIHGIYAGADPVDNQATIDFAAQWIRRHRELPPC